MSILIKGMEMPKSCWVCGVGGAQQMDNATCPFYSMEFWEQEEYRDKIADGCPLVPVPPHGRLINANAFESIKYELPSGQKAFNRGFHSGVQYVQRLIMDAPTVIEAEDGET